MIEAVFSPSGTICDGQRDEPERRHHRGQAEQQRHAGGDERAERDTRMSSVIGSESVSAFLKSSSNAFESALFALAEPNSPT